MATEKIERELEEKKEYIKRAFHIKEIGIFGSFIRGEQTASSDIESLSNLRGDTRTFLII